jgi:hypothetical protein
MSMIPSLICGPTSYSSSTHLPPPLSSYGMHWEKIRKAFARYLIFVNGFPRKEVIATLLKNGNEIMPSYRCKISHILKE